MITVHLHTILQRQTEQERVGKLEIPWTPNLDLAGLLTKLAINFNEEHILLVVNGLISEPDALLQDGDEVHLIPAISGGSTWISHYNTAYG